MFEYTPSLKTYDWLPFLEDDFLEIEHFIEHCKKLTVFNIDVELVRSHELES